MCRSLQYLLIDLFLFFGLNLLCGVGRPARVRNVAAQLQLFQGDADLPIGNVAELIGSNEELIAEVHKFKPWAVLLFLEVIGS